MAVTPSNMMDLGTQAPKFTLLDTVSGENLSLSDIKSDIATVIMFICNHCPFVLHVNPELVRMANDYQAKGIKFIAISSNSVESHPQDGPEHMTTLAKELNFPFPYLYDESQEVAQSYMAACTPDFYIFDGSMKCAYRGQLDDSRPGNNIPLSGSDMRNALDSIISGAAVSADQKPSVGCNIKWKSA